MQRKDTFPCVTLAWTINNRILSYYVASKHACKHEVRRSPRVINQFRLDSNHLSFISDGVNNMDGYKINS